MKNTKIQLDYYDSLGWGHFSCSRKLGLKEPGFRSGTKIGIEDRYWVLGRKSSHEVALYIKLRCTRYDQFETCTWCEASTYVKYTVQDAVCTFLPVRMKYRTTGHDFSWTNNCCWRVWSEAMYHTTLNLNLRDHSYSCYYTGSPNIFVQTITILLYQVPGIYSHTYWSCRIQQTNETYATSQQVRKYKWLNPSCPIHTYEAGKTILPGVSLGLRLAGGCPCSLFVPLSLLLLERNIRTLHVPPDTQLSKLLILIILNGDTLVYRGDVIKTKLFDRRPRVWAREYMPLLIAYHDPPRVPRNVAVATACCCWVFYWQK